MTVTLNYTYRIYPDAKQQAKLDNWLETCRSAYNYALGEVKDWIKSLLCSWDKCSLEKCYIIPADAPYPGYYNQQNALPVAKKQFPRLKEVPSQVLQTTIKRVHDAFDYFRARGFGFPRFKKYGHIRSMLYPQIKPDAVTDWQITLPKLGKIAINLHRPIPHYQLPVTSYQLPVTNLCCIKYFCF